VNLSTTRDKKFNKKKQLMDELLTERNRIQELSDQTIKIEQMSEKMRENVKKNPQRGMKRPKPPGSSPPRRPKRPRK